MKHRYLAMTNAFFDRTGIVRRLEKLALRGWRLEKIGGLFWKFGRIPARKLRYAVTYFPEVSAFDPGLPEKRSEFLDYCEAAGWQLCGSNGQLQIFVNEDPEAVDLETEPGPEIENIHRSVKKSWLPSMVLLTCVGFMNMGTWLVDLLNKPVYTFSEPFKMFSFVIWVTLLTLTLGEITLYYRWRKKALANAAEGRFTPTAATWKLELGAVVVTLAALLGYLLLGVAGRWRVSMLAALVPGLALMVTCVLVIRLCKKLKLPGKKTKIIYWTVCSVLGLLYVGVAVAGAVRYVGEESLHPDPAATQYQYQGHTFTRYHDELPLTVSDLTGADPARYSRRLERESTPFLTRTFCRDSTLVGQKEALPTMWYTILEVRAGFLYDICLHSDRDILADWEGIGDMTPADPAPWNADAAWVEESTWLVAWPDKLVRIEFFGMDPTEDQLRTAAAALR